MFAAAFRVCTDTPPELLPELLPDEELFDEPADGVLTPVKSVPRVSVTCVVPSVWAAVAWESRVSVAVGVAVSAFVSV
jgi:hypothetical protein